MLAEESFPVCKLRSAYARQCQSTIAWQRAKTEVDERFVASCVRARFPQITYNSQPGHTPSLGQSIRSGLYGQGCSVCVFIAIACIFVVCWSFYIALMSFRSGRLEQTHCALMSQVTQYKWVTAFYSALLISTPLTHRASLSGTSSKDVVNQCLEFVSSQVV